MKRDSVVCILRISLLENCFRKLYRSVNDFLVCASRFQLSILKQGAVDRHISVSLTLDHRPHMYSQDTRCQD